jgi:hypothetical protein
MPPRNWFEFSKKNDRSGSNEVRSNGFVAVTQRLRYDGSVAVISEFLRTATQ